MIVAMPSALHSYTGASQVEAQGETVGALMADLDRRYPGLRFRIIDEQDRFRRHIRCFVNGTQCFDMGLALDAQDEVVLVQALSGG
jgi:molybdopterin converting factor small subunit